MPMAAAWLYRRYRERLARLLEGQFSGLAGAGIE